MTRLFLALGVAMVALTAIPAEARHHGHRAHMYACTRYRHGHCVAVHRYRLGYLFGPSYAYTGYGALPQPIVTQYRLRPTYRYVHENGYVYVVNPNTYRVVRVIPLP